MTEQAISPPRRRMIEDMSIRKFASKTQHDYVQRVKDFAAFLGRSPDTAKSEDVRGFRLHLASSGAGTPKINATVSALRFFFKVTLDSPELAKHLAFMHEPRKVPVVLSPEEVARFLEAAPGVKYKAALSVAYGAGLRVSEVVALKVSDIDSKRMMLRVEQGKGRKDRHAMLSHVLLKLLREWYCIARPQGQAADRAAGDRAGAELRGRRASRGLGKNDIRALDRAFSPTFRAGLYPLSGGRRAARQPSDPLAPPAGRRRRFLFSECRIGAVGGAGRAGRRAGKQG